MSFINSLLLDRVAYGFAGGPTFATTQVKLHSGINRRNAERSRPLHRYSASFMNIQSEDLGVVVAAYNACLGATHSFRFFDRMDYKLDDEVIGTADGTTDQELQLIKTYSFGGTETERTITKPVDSTVDYGRGTNRLGAAPAFVIKADGTPISFTLDYSTGIVTFTASAGESITASGWFDVPVHFVHDELMFSVNNLDAHSADIELAEDFSA